MEQFRDVNDVETLKSMLVAQQQQLQQLQARQEPAGPVSKKRKGSSSRSAEAELLEGSGSEDDIPLDKDDDIWDPSNDSDYDDAPKKKSKSSSSSKKATVQKGRKQKQSTMDAAYGESDVSEREQEKTVKAAAAALRSIKSAINGQMVSC